MDQPSLMLYAVGQIGHDQVWTETGEQHLGIGGVALRRFWIRMTWNGPNQNRNLPNVGASELNLTS